MKATISPTYLAKHLTEVLSGVREHGDTYTIADSDGDIAELGPIEPPRGITWREFLELYPSLPTPDDKFADDLEQVHAEMNQMPLKLPEWPC